MTNRTTLLALAERVEAATGADRELDEDIGIAIGRGRTVRVGHECLGNVRDVPINCPRYTASLDAAMSLVPSGWSFTVGLSENRMHAQAKLGRSYPTNAQAYSEASTPALALTAAALRARAEEMSDD